MDADWWFPNKDDIKSDDNNSKINLVDVGNLIKTCVYKVACNVTFAEYTKRVINFTDTIPEKSGIGDVNDAVPYILFKKHATNIINNTNEEKNTYVIDNGLNNILLTDEITKIAFNNVIEGEKSLFDLLDESIKESIIEQNCSEKSCEEQKYSIKSSMSRRPRLRRPKRRPYSGGAPKRRQAKKVTEEIDEDNPQTVEDGDGVNETAEQKADKQGDGLSKLEGFKVKPNADKEKLETITFGLHVATVLIILGCFCFDANGVQRLMNGEFDAIKDVFALNKNFVASKNFLANATLQCSNPIAMFTASVGQKLYCKILNDWNKLVAEATRGTSGNLIENIVFTFLSGGTMLAGLGAFIQKIKPITSAGFKVYMTIITMLAFTILYLSYFVWNVLMPISSVTGVLSYRTYKAMTRVVTKSLVKPQRDESTLRVRLNIDYGEPSGSGERENDLEKALNERVNNIISSIFSTDKDVDREAKLGELSATLESVSLLGLSCYRNLKQNVKDVLGGLANDEDLTTAANLIAGERGIRGIEGLSILEEQEGGGRKIKYKGSILDLITGKKKSKKTTKTTKTTKKEATKKPTTKKVATKKATAKK